MCGGKSFPLAVFLAWLTVKLLSFSRGEKYENSGAAAVKAKQRFNTLFSMFFFSGFERSNRIVDFSLFEI